MTVSKYLSNDNNKVAAHCGRHPPLRLQQWLRSLKVLDPWQVALILLQLSHDFHSDLAGVVHFTEVTTVVLDLVSFYCRYIFIRFRGDFNLDYDEQEPMGLWRVTVPLLRGCKRRGTSFRL